MDRLNQTIDQKRFEFVNWKGDIFHQDYARPQTSLMMCQKLRELEILMYPPYSTHIAHNYYHLFRTLQKYSMDVKLASTEACESHLPQLLARKDKNCFEKGIMKLPSKRH